MLIFLFMHYYPKHDIFWVLQHVRTNVRIVQQTPKLENSCSMRSPNSKLKAANSEDSIKPSGR
jgi:hypothetical protein